MSIDNENDDMDAENPGGTGVATAPSIDDLDAAMAALIRAASPSESTQAQSAMEPARSGPAMALVNSVSIMDEDDDDFFDDDEETEEAQDQAPAPVAQRQASPPAPIPFRAPQPQTEQPAPAPAPMQYAQPPQQAPQPAPVAAEYQQPQYTPPQPQPAPVQPEYSAPQPVQMPEPQPQQMAAPPQATQPQPLPQQAMAPQAVAYQQPVAAAQPQPQPQAPTSQQNSVSQHARATLMQHETNQDKHLHDASRYIRQWLEENTNDEEVVEAAMDWARKHKNADHNGHVIASLLLLENADNEVTVMAVRWLTHHSMHQLAPEVVAGLTRRQQQ